jgi:hypothetical protein
VATAILAASTFTAGAAGFGTGFFPHARKSSRRKT